jgi:hypothetical protein
VLGSPAVKARRTRILLVAWNLALAAGVVATGVAQLWPPAMVSLAATGFGLIAFFALPLH